MELPIYQIDAFAGKQFGGNAAAVVPLAEWLDDSILQRIAAENNLSETAFYTPCGDDFHLRWFTPAAEVDLCGHATLATAWVLYRILNHAADSICFHTLSGPLYVSCRAQRLRMDFPATPARPAVAARELIRALGIPPRQILESRDILFVYDTADEVRRLVPDLHAMASLVPFGLIATAPGPADGQDACDFVSRFFAPAMGVPEDPATGSAHCTLAPFWAGMLQKTSFYARQLSQRGGEIWCELQGDRVLLEGEAVLYLQGTIHV